MNEIKILLRIITVLLTIFILLFIINTKLVLNEIKKPPLIGGEVPETIIIESE